MLAFYLGYTADTLLQRLLTLIVFLVSIFVVIAGKQEAKFQCLCTTRACRSEGVAFCQTMHWCYVDFAPFYQDNSRSQADWLTSISGQCKWAGKELERGCIDESHPLLCDPLLANPGSMFQLLISSAKDPAEKTLWPRLECCNNSPYCNSECRPMNYKLPPSNPDEPIEKMDNLTSAVETTLAKNIQSKRNESSVTEPLNLLNMPPLVKGILITCLSFLIVSLLIVIGVICWYNYNVPTKPAEWLSKPTLWTESPSKSQLSLQVAYSAKSCSTTSRAVTSQHNITTYHDVDGLYV